MNVEDGLDSKVFCPHHQHPEADGQREGAFEHHLTQPGLCTALDEANVGERSN
jgi:hypothetical protein